MATVTKIQNIGYYTVGSIISLTVNFVKNNGPDIAVGVEVDLTIPTGLTYDSSSLEQGTYDDMTGTWSVGSLLKGQSVTAIFNFEVTDDTEGPWSVIFDVSASGGCDSCLSNNQVCIVTSGISCSDLKPCHDPVINTVTADHTVLLTDEVIFADGSSNTVDVTLPDASSSNVFNVDTNQSKKYTIKAIDISNAVTVLTGGEKIIKDTDTAGASSSVTLTPVGNSITVVSNGTDWLVIASN